MTGPVTALIAEDEAPQRRELRAMLGAAWPELDIVAECEDGLAALEAWTASKPAIVFLDIQMPGLTGLEVARAAGSDAQIVFITAYDEYAVKAFEAGAVDYLLKPICAERLAATVKRLRARGTAAPPPDLDAMIHALAGRFAPRQPIRWITASVGDTIRMIAIDDVLFFQAEDKYTRVATASDSAHIRMPLKELMTQLDPEMFWRVHRNAIVRVAAIRRAKPDEDGHMQVWLDGVPEPIRVSESFRHRFKAM
jgi:DNA-binding LytR/AlgR family response regulator